VRFGFWREFKRRDRDRDRESSIQLVHCFVFELVRKGRSRTLSVFEVGRLSVCLLVGTKGFLLERERERERERDTDRECVCVCFFARFEIVRSIKSIARGCWNSIEKTRGVLAPKQRVCVQEECASNKLGPVGE
jgi:hypothetical protein